MQHGGNRLAGGGALWAAAFLRDVLLEALAGRLYGRIDWRRWTAPNGLLRHGKEADGHPIRCTWDRLNGETASLYVLAAGAEEGRAAPASCWQALRTFEGEAGGLRFGSADLGLFVFQYGLDLLDLRGRRPPDGRDLWAEAGLAAEANQRVCRGAAALPNLPALLGPVRRRRAGRSAGPRFLPRLRSVRPHRRHGAPDRRRRVRRPRSGGGPRKPLPGRARPFPGGPRPLRVQQRQLGSELGGPRHGRHRRRRPGAGPGQLPGWRPRPGRLPRPALRRRRLRTTRLRTAPRHRPPGVVSQARPLDSFPRGKPSAPLIRLHYVPLGHRHFRVPHRERSRSCAAHFCWPPARAWPPSSA